MAYGNSRFCYTLFAICHRLIRPSHALFFSDGACPERSRRTRAWTLRVRHRCGVFVCGWLRGAILFGEPLLELNDFLGDDT